MTIITGSRSDDCDGGEVTSGGMIYIPSYINIGSRIQKFLGRAYTCRDTETHREQGDLIKLVSFSENKESMLKRLLFLLYAELQE